jgi:putative toxin-antitoxin system antitoxin component (TIGR02293 family)
MNARGLPEKLYSFEPLERIALVREGAPAELVNVLVGEMAITRDRLYRIAGVPRATIDRKLRARGRLNQDETERMIGIARLVGQAGQIVKESGNAKTFDAGVWVAEWLDTPVPALDGRHPATFMDTAEGRGLVSELLARMQTGAYA